MEKNRLHSTMVEPATYQIGILGILDPKWSDYYGGMTIKHESEPNRGAITILTGQLTDQAALLGVLNSLYDFGCPILSVECVEAQ